ncbi:MAG: hypothetical protein ACLUD2_03925 [Clostridium sp.]
MQITGTALFPGDIAPDMPSLSARHRLQYSVRESAGSSRGARTVT